MSKVYDALKRLEAERDARERESARSRSSSSSSWWKGVVCGFVVGIGMAAFPVRLLFEPRQSALPLASTRPTAEGASAPPAVVARAAFAEEPSPSPLPALEADATRGEAPVATIPGMEAGEPPALVTAETAAAPRAPVAPAVPARGQGRMSVQVGTFRHHDNAARLVAELEAKRFPATISSGRSTEASWVVRVGAYPDRSAAQAMRAALQREGVSGFIVTE